jgi:hypothetical protein
MNQAFAPIPVKDIKFHACSAKWFFAHNFLKVPIRMQVSDGVDGFGASKDADRKKFRQSPRPVIGLAGLTAPFCAYSERIDENNRLFIHSVLLKMDTGLKWVRKDILAQVSYETAFLGLFLPKSGVFLL